MDIPLFPLTTVLFPGGPLPLRIFGPRYIDMISHCMKSDAPFGVVLIREGSETGEAETYEVGTLATITASSAGRLTAPRSMVSGWLVSTPMLASSRGSLEP